mmetsp:Transcript_39704/g.69826  ORF Transcript_39704/g.69826 Transcript_39704/m.69826 type:complete len:241 (-) Transcript_39704:132-854(-)
MSSYLDLTVNTSKELELATWNPANQISSSIHAADFTRSIGKCIGYELLSCQLRSSYVPFCDERSADQKLSRNSNWLQFEAARRDDVQERSTYGLTYGWMEFFRSKGVDRCHNCALSRPVVIIESEVRCTRWRCTGFQLLATRVKYTKLLAAFWPSHVQGQLRKRCRKQADCNFGLSNELEERCRVCATGFWHNMNGGSMSEKRPQLKVDGVEAVTDQVRGSIGSDHGVLIGMPRNEVSQR